MYFYAAGEDLLDVAMLVLEETDCRLYEADSEIDQPLRELDVEDIRRWIERKRSAERYLGLAAWPPATKQRFRIRNVRLQTPDGGVRQIAEGWGLIWLHLFDVRDGSLARSTVNANSEARARRWADTHAELGPVDAWNWSEVARLHRRIERLIRTRLVVDSYDGVLMLAGAGAAFRSGVKPSPI